MDDIQVVKVYEAGWTECTNAQGDAFFFNLQSNEVSWTLPPDAGVPAATKPSMDNATPSQHYPEGIPSFGLGECGSPPVEIEIPAQQLESPATILQKLGDWLI